MILKIEKFEEDLSGIYKIQNNMNGHYYIGSAYHFKNRFKTHHSTLKRNKHNNKHLQNAYNKYGATAFTFSIIEKVDINQVYIVENKYLNMSFDNGKTCYNMNSSSDPSNILRDINNKKTKTITLISPSGDIITFTATTIANFARNIHIPDCSFSDKYQGIYAVLKNKVTSYKGWRKPENLFYDFKNWRKNRKTNYKTKYYDIPLRSPSGEKIIIGQNLHEFCRRYNIKNPSDISNLIAGRTRYVNGWSLFNNLNIIEKNAKLFKVKLVSPQGIEYRTIENLTKFCKVHNLCITSIRNLLTFQKKTNEYRGWKIYK